MSSQPATWLKALAGALRNDAGGGGEQQKDKMATMGQGMVATGVRRGQTTVLRVVCHSLDFRYTCTLVAHSPRGSYCQPLL